MSFSQALSGLAAQQENIRVISNNIANSKTVGFKSAGVSFADVYTGASAVGMGVSVSGITQNFAVGSLEQTGRALDMAIAGDGFYRLQQSNGEVIYSRNGEFNQDANGFIVNQTGQYLTGYPTNAEFGGDILAGGMPEPIQINTQDMPPNATSMAAGTYNLDSSTVPGEDLSSATLLVGGTDEEIQYHYAFSFTVYDSLGNDHIVTSYFTRNTDTNPSAWDVKVSLDGQAEDTNPSFTLEFDENGSLMNTPSEFDLTFDATTYGFPDANSLEITYDFNGSSQFNSESAQSAMTQDGYSSGSLIGLEVQEDGTITRIYSNQQRDPAGQLVLVNFANPQGLQPDGDNAWRRTGVSGEPLIGIAGTGMFGGIVGATLEGSNVDLTSQLVDLITAQRAYQANSSSITTQDEMLQTVLNL